MMWDSGPTSATLNHFIFWWWTKPKRDIYYSLQSNKADEVPINKAADFIFKLCKHLSVWTWDEQLSLNEEETALQVKRFRITSGTTGQNNVNLRCSEVQPHGLLEKSLKVKLQLIFSHISLLGKKMEVTKTANKDVLWVSYPAQITYAVM